MRLHDFLEYWARATPEADFAVFRGERLSYAEADARANPIAHALAAAGLELGERAAILAKGEIIDFCRGQLAGYKRPALGRFHRGAPRNPSGKILKRELRAPYWKDRQRGVNK